MSLLTGQKYVPPTRYNGIPTAEAILGTPLPIVIGQQRVSWKLLWYGDFTSKKAKQQGSSGLAKGGVQYVYSASVIGAVCLGQASNFLAAWDSISRYAMDTYGETFTVPSGGSPTYTPVNQAIFRQDLGAGVATPYSVTANDYGSPGSVTLTGTQQVPLVFTTSPTPAAGQYTVNGSNQYVFNAAQTGESVTINYVAFRYHLQQTELDVIPTASPYQVTVQFQTEYSSDAGVAFFPSGVALKAVSGTPTVSGTYNPNGGNYLFASADAGLGITISYVYVDPNTDTNAPATLNLTFFNGALGQSPWSYMTSSHPGEALGYSELSYVASSGMYLGYSPLLPQLNFEILGSYSFGNGIPDANPADAISALLTNPTYKLNFPSGNIDSSLITGDSSARAMWGANNFFISAILDSPSPLMSVIGSWCEAGQVYVSWDEGKLKFIPLSDTTAVANGFTYTPPTQPVVDLDDNDFVVTEGSDPITIEQTPWQNRWNRVSVRWSVRTNSYNEDLLQVQDEASVQQYGLMIEDAQDYQFICTEASAQFAANMRLQRYAAIYTTYKFTLKSNFAFLSPGDIVTVTDGLLNTSGTMFGRTPVRITSMNDDPQQGIQIEAETFPWSVGTSLLYNRQAQLPSNTNDGPQQDPGDTTALVFEVPNRAQNFTGNNIYVFVNGQNINWGGCDVYVSFNGVDYNFYGQFDTPARIGTLNTVLPFHADPDNDDILSITMQQEGSSLLSVTAADRDAFVTLSAIISPGQSFTPQGTATLGANIGSSPAGSTQFGPEIVTIGENVSQTTPAINPAWSNPTGVTTPDTLYASTTLTLSASGTTQTLNPTAFFTPTASKTAPAPDPTFFVGGLPSAIIAFTSLTGTTGSGAITTVADSGIAYYAVNVWDGFSNPSVTPFNSVLTVVWTPTITDANPSTNDSVLILYSTDSGVTYQVFDAFYGAGSPGTIISSVTLPLGTDYTKVRVRVSMCIYDFPFSGGTIATGTVTVSNIQIVASLNATEQQSQWLFAGNIAELIPQGVGAITGVELTCSAYVSAHSGAPPDNEPMLQAVLTSNGITLGTFKTLFDSTSFPTTPTNYTLGSSTDLWGLLPGALSADQINDLNFGVYFLAQINGNFSASPSSTFSVSNAVLTITWEDTGTATPWTNPGNVASSSSYATCTLGPNSISSLWLAATGYSFNLPFGFVLDGIEVTVNAESSSGTGDLTVSMLAGGLRVGLPKNKPVNGTATDYVFGSNTDTFNENFTVDQLNDPTQFGVAILMTGPSGATLSCNNVRISLFGKSLYNLELISYENVQLTGFNSYALSSLRRGVYGSFEFTHPGGSQFVRMDQATFTYQIDPTFIGETIFFKFCSFNNYGNQLQSLDNVPAISVQIGGLAIGAVDAANGTLQVGTPSFSRGDIDAAVSAVHGSFGAQNIPSGYGLVGPSTQASGVPVWKPIFAGGGGGGGGSVANIFVIDATGNVTAAAWDFIDCNTSLGSFTVSLPSASATTSEDAAICIKKTSSDANTVTITPNGSDTIEDVASVTLARKGDSVYLVSDGVSNWDIFAGWITPANDFYIYTPPIAGNYAASQELYFSQPPRGFTLPSGLTGSNAGCRVAPTSAVQVTLLKNGSSIGTINIASGATTATFTFTSAVTINGSTDTFSMTAPATQDRTFAGFWCDLLATRSL